MATELVRVLVFYHSDQRDISGASEESVLIIRVNCVALARQWRKLNAELWDAFIENVLTQVQGGGGAREQSLNIITVGCER